MEVFADLPDDPREGGPEQLLHVVRPRAVPVVCLQVVNPLKGKRKIEEEKFSSTHRPRRGNYILLPDDAAKIFSTNYFHCFLSFQSIV